MRLLLLAAVVLAACGGPSRPAADSASADGDAPSSAMTDSTATLALAPTASPLAWRVLAPDRMPHDTAGAITLHWDAAPMAAAIGESVSGRFATGTRVDAVTPVMAEIFEAFVAEGGSGGITFAAPLPTFTFTATRRSAVPATGAPSAAAPSAAAPSATAPFVADVRLADGGDFVLLFVPAARRLVLSAKDSAQRDAVLRSFGALAVAARPSRP